LLDDSSYILDGGFRPLVALVQHSLNLDYCGCVLKRSPTALSLSILFTLSFIIPKLLMRPCRPTHYWITQAYLSDFHADWLL